jgi:hypothetical protein
VENNISREAKIFAKYLAGVKIDDVTALLYAKAIEARLLLCEGHDKRLETFILKYPFWIGFVDAALALTDKQSVLRKKIFVMLAIMETSPEYTEFFLAKKGSFFTLIRICAVGTRSVYRFILGFFLIKLFGKA